MQVHKQLESLPDFCIIRRIVHFRMLLENNQLQHDERFPRPFTLIHPNKVLKFIQYI